jgi:folate-binding protein YgfZ
MSTFTRLVLPDRAVVAVRGDDAVTFLDKLATNALDDVATGDVRFAALLSPQGKILAEFFAWRTEDGFRLDTRAADATALMKRLALYKLRAKIEIEDVSSRLSVVVAPDVSDALRADPREARLGARGLVEHVAGAVPAAALAVYHTHRIALAIPEGGADYAIGDTYPHEANLDRLAGVSFTKGCFVGQEVVARMQHKTVVRKRVVRIEGDADLTSGVAILAGDADIGRVGSVAGRSGLALVRLDRALEARAAGTPLLAAAVPIRIDAAALDAFATAAASRD